MAVVEKTVYETEDGQTFTKKQDALNHETKQEIVKSLENIKSIYGDLELNDLNDTVLRHLFEIGTKAYKILDSKK